MTTNETMQDLLKMIGGVEWKTAGGRKWTLWRGILAWERYSECDSRGITGHEAQALIEKAAIEWLVERKAITIVGPNASEPDTWAVTIGKGPCQGPIWYRGSTLLEALHEAVKAVKESKHDN